MIRAAARSTLFAGLIISLSAYGQVADLTKARCAHLLELPRNDRGQLIVWLHGYYAGAAQRPVLDRSRLEDALAGLQQLCERNRAMLLIGSEARSLFLGEAPPLSPVAPPGAQVPAGQAPATPPLAR